MEITGIMYRDMVVSAACSLDNKKEMINNLNVFPVPDGDTGINMSLTMSGVRGDYTACELPLGECAQKAANLMLRGARGNSGVILSLFFRGISKAWKETETAGTDEVIKAFERGVSEAYKAVMNPTEGTILTVMRVMTENADAAVKRGDITDVPELFAYMLEEAKKTLDTTPELLPILKEAGVVDSGGCGFVAVMEGMCLCIQGSPVKAEHSADEGSGVPSGADFSSFDTENIKYAYCTECIVTKSRKYEGENTADRLHQFIMKLGDSVVFVDDAEIIKLHVHTNAPGKVLTEALRYGTLYTVKIENMKRQHSSLSGEETSVPEKEHEKEEKNASGKEESAEPVKEYGFVSVCMGDGLSSLFNDLQADVVVSGGQTMNPSTDDIVSACRRTPAKVVFVLPNNKNIFMVSTQAARIIKDKKVVVLETTSVPEGVSAMLAFDADADLETNEAAMKEAVSGVTTLSLTYAVRDTKIGDTEIKAGQTLGLLNGKIVCTSDTRASCVKGLLTKVDSAAVITVYTGAEAEESETGEICHMLSEKFPDSETVIVAGGQPVYSYIVSIE